MFAIDSEKSGQLLLFYDGRAADKGTWSISSNQVNVDSLTSSVALLLASPALDIVNTRVKITFPSGSSTAKAGLGFGHDGTNNYYIVIINRSTGKIELRQVTGGTPGGVLAGATVTIADNTQYTLGFYRKQKHVDVSLLGQASFGYDSSSDFSTGQSGLYSTATNVKFDDFGVQDGTARPSLTPGMVGLPDASISAGDLLVQGRTGGGEAIIDTFKGDDAYMVQPSGGTQNRHSRESLCNPGLRANTPRRGRSRESQKNLVRPWAQLAPVGDRPHGMVGW